MSLMDEVEERTKELQDQNKQGGEAMEQGAKDVKRFEKEAGQVKQTKEKGGGMMGAVTRTFSDQDGRDR